MTPKELKQRVDAVSAVADHEDHEAAHEAEDQLHLDVIREFCPDWVQVEIKRLSDTDFCRWCA